MKGVSVIVCCYNSAGRIVTTLDHLAKQTASKVADWEVIIVDNSSTDDTVRVCTDFSQASGFPLRICHENEPGLTNARIKGAIEARFDYLIFCDDDNWLSPDYVETVYQFFTTTNEYAAIGGCGEAVFEEGNEPSWFQAHAHAYAVGSQGDSTGDVTPRGFVWGAGMGLRKELFLCATAPEFPLLLTDRKGSNLSTGGDSELCLRFIIMGYRLYYNSRLRFKHFIPLSRLSLTYVEKLRHGVKNSQEILLQYWLFIRFKLQDHRRIRSKIKYSLYYFLHKLGLVTLQRPTKLLITIVTNRNIEGFSSDLKLIESFSNAYRKNG